MSKRMYAQDELDSIVRTKLKEKEEEYDRINHKIVSGGFSFCSFFMGGLINFPYSTLEGDSIFFAGLIPIAGALSELTNPDNKKFKDKTMGALEGIAKKTSYAAIIPTFLKGAEIYNTQIEPLLTDAYSQCQNYVDFFIDKIF